jgi:NDP-sugar pyrophosphorylase family protein
MSFFGDGTKWGVTIDYSIEEEPLSTIGPLTLIDDLPDNFLVMNGDILSDIDYNHFFDYHVNRRNKVTVASFKRKSKIDYGVIRYDDNKVITGFEEKPVFDFDVSMGVYCIRRDVIERLEKNACYGFDDLMINGVKNKEKFEAWPYSGFWIDIGRPEDYAYCNDNYQEIKELLKL